MTRVGGSRDDRGCDQQLPRGRVLFYLKRQFATSGAFFSSWFHVLCVRQTVEEAPNSVSSKLHSGESTINSGGSSAISALDVSTRSAAPGEFIETSRTR